MCLPPPPLASVARTAACSGHDFPFPCAAISDHHVTILAHPLCPPCPPSQPSLALCQGTASLRFQGQALQAHKLLVRRLRSEVWLDGGIHRGPDDERHRVPHRNRTRFRAPFALPPHTHHSPPLPPSPYNTPPPPQLRSPVVPYWLNACRSKC